MDKDAWKEKFLLEIEENYEIENTILTYNKDYMILVLPFYNEEMRKANFDNSVSEWIARI